MKRLTKALVVVAFVIIVSGFVLLRAFGGPDAPQQPVEFDHWQHISKPDGPQLDCSFCHEFADKSRFATIPNISTCMACHDSLLTDSPKIHKLASFASNNAQPPWVRIYWFDSSADVFFSHKPHIRSGIDCSECHGQVAEAHVISRQSSLSMGWCIDCHRSRGASLDCYICHR